MRLKLLTIFHLSLGINIATTLYPHQKKALTFLLEREGEKPAPSGKSISLWTVRKDQLGNIRSWYNVVTQKEVTKEPREAKGAILADDVSSLYFLPFPRYL